MFTAKSYRHVAILVALLFTFALAACGAPQDASRSRSGYVADHGATVAARSDASEAELLRGIMPADEIRVEGYLNYYKQNFPPPPFGYALGLDAALGSTHVPDSGGEVWLQIGLQAAKATEEDIRPLNVALVLDKSGSMADADKMSYLKQSLHIFLEELDPEDLIAIVVYDTEARVLLPTQSVGDGQAVREAIDSLRPGGATNLHGGLMLGYAEVEKYYSPDLNNRVILLTDGIANRGETDPDKIAADSLAYNQKDIYLSTIGLGLNFNDELLYTLAEQGKGNYHFISDADEMERIFRQEAAGLVQTVATNVWLTLDLGSGAQVQRVYGYDYDLKGSTMRVQFDDAGAESNQILVVKMIVPAGEGTEQTLAHARLEYDDVFAEMHDVQEAELTVSFGAPAPYDPLVSPSVRRNATVLKMAETLQQVSYLCDQRKYQEALDLVKEVKADVWQIATEESDEEMQEDVELLSNYETILQKLVETVRARPTAVSKATPRQTPVVVYEERRGMCCAAPMMVMGLVTLALAMMWIARRW